MTKIEISPGRWVAIDSDLFADVHEQLAEEGRARGLTGNALDELIAGALPDAIMHALASCENETVH